MRCSPREGLVWGGQPWLSGLCLDAALWPDGPVAVACVAVPFLSTQRGKFSCLGTKSRRCRWVLQCWLTASFEQQAITPAVWHIKVQNEQGPKFMVFPLGFQQPLFSRSQHMGSLQLAVRVCYSSLPFKVKFQIHVYRLFYFLGVFLRFTQIK